MIVLHIIEKFFNSGAFSSLMEIYSALSDSSLINHQKIICLKIGSPKKQINIPNSFPLGSEVMQHYDFLKYIKSNGPENFICIFHKLMCSPTRSISSIINQSGAKSIVVNHTFTEVMSYNNLYRFDACIAVSDHMVKKLEPINKKMKFFSIKNVVDFERINKYKFSINENEVFFSGRINAFNNIKYSPEFIKWISGIRLSKKHVHQYVGSGPYIKDAISVAQSCDNEFSKVEILGPIWEEETKIKTLKSWDAFVYDINRPEGTSMSVLESLACGVPVICRDLPGNNEVIVNGINGFVFSDYSEASKLISDFFKNEKNIIEMKSSTANWALNNLNKNKFKEKYEEAIYWVVKNAEKQSSNLTIKTLYDKRKSSKKENIKKIVVKNFAIKSKLHKVKKINKSPLVYGKKEENNSKSNLSYKTGARSLANNKCKYTYFPILGVHSFFTKDIFCSDYFIISFGIFDLNLEYFNIEFEEKEKIFFVNDSGTKCVVDLKSKILFKKTDIIVIPLSCVYEFKNFLLYNENKIWEEKEK
jgi:glycosyltransferase involved in cell wall biosynthesis